MDFRNPQVTEQFVIAITRAFNSGRNVGRKMNPALS
jgi:hypothetical protein